MSMSMSDTGSSESGPNGLLARTNKIDHLAYREGRTWLEGAFFSRLPLLHF